MKKYRNPIYLCGFVSLLSVLPAYAVVQTQSPIPPALCMDESSIHGTWVTDNGQSIVLIENCGNQKICGHSLKFLTTPEDSSTQQSNLPNFQVIKGKRILEGFVMRSVNQYSGTIINPKNGKSYKSKLKLKDDDKLKVKGCLGPICESRIWSRPENCRS